MTAGWSSPVARQAHNLKVLGSNPSPATNFALGFVPRRFCFFTCRSCRHEPHRRHPDRSVASRHGGASNSGRAVQGRGLAGDRYFLNLGTFSPTPQKPDFELTLIEEEQIEAFAAASGLPFTAAHARRNIVTRGVALNELVGREFLLGPVRVRGLRLCEPCNYLAKISFPETLKGLVHKGGLRAQILTEGILCTGDMVGTVP